MSSPETFLGIARGFMESRVLLTAVELDLFSLLADGPLTADQVCARARLDLRAATMVLDALAAMGLLSKSAAGYQATPDSGALLAASAPGSVLPMAQHVAHLWERWSRLTEIVQHGVTSATGPAPRSDAALRAFIGAMHVIGAPQADSVIASIELDRVASVIDVGGASGTYTMAFLRRRADLRATLFDLPPVVELARERLTEAGLLDRVTLAPGDFYADELPSGHDLAWVSAIIHQNSLEQNVELYGRVFRALRPGGRIVVRDHIMSPDRTAPRPGAMFAINMLVATPGGGTYTEEEVADGLRAAGFHGVRLLQPDQRMNGLIEATRP